MCDLIWSGRHRPQLEVRLKDVRDFTVQMAREEGPKQTEQPARRPRGGSLRLWMTLSVRVPGPLVTELNGEVRTDGVWDEGGAASPGAHGSGAEWQLSLVSQSLRAEAQDMTVGCWARYWDQAKTLFPLRLWVILHPPR